MPDLNSVLTLGSGLKAADLATIGVTGASLGITPASLGVVDAESRLFREVTDGSRKPFSIPTIKSLHMRNSGWSYNFSSGDAWTAYYNYLTGSGSNADMERAFWFSLGTNTRQNTLNYSETMDNRTIEYATNSVVGGFEVTSGLDNRSNYCPMIFRTMFIRNFHPTLSKTITMWGHYSNYWSAGYEGSGIAVGLPNVNGSYAGVTDINWSCPANRSSGNSNYTWSWNVTIPAKTTAVVVQANTGYYWRSNQYLQNNKFYDLHNTFTDFWVQPDHKMTQAASLYNDFNNEFSVRNSYRVWQFTAQQFGDR
jgi:hypothetical protein